MISNNRVWLWVGENNTIEVFIESAAIVSAYELKYYSSFATSEDYWEIAYSTSEYETIPTTVGLTEEELFQLEFVWESRENFHYICAIQKYVYEYVEAILPGIQRDGLHNHEIRHEVELEY